jgi:hypothetical protein
MKVLRIVLLLVVAAAVVVALVAPIGPVPGFFIGGTPSEAPDRWPDTSSTHEIRLKVPGTPPRVVIVWVIDHGGELHVVGARGSGWVTMLGEGGPVEMRLDDNTYALNAVRLTDGWEAVLNAYVEKYRPDYPDIIDSFPTLEEAATQASVFRLDRSTR